MLCVHDERYLQNAKLFLQIQLGCVIPYFFKQKSMTYLLKNNTHVNRETLVNNRKLMVKYSQARVNRDPN